MTKDGTNHTAEFDWPHDKEDGLEFWKHMVEWLAEFDPYGEGGLTLKSPTPER